MSPITIGDEAWTLVVNRGHEASAQEEAVIVHFLMPSAPHEWLEAGTTFDLTEGKRVVASGQVAQVFDLSMAA
jgi:hypothetical protein